MAATATHQGPAAPHCLQQPPRVMEAKKHARTAGMALLLRLQLLLAVAAVAAAGAQVQADSIELSPSIQLAGKYDWEVLPAGGQGGQPWSRCLDTVWRAVDANSSRLNFVPTHHWLPLDTASNGISAFCTMTDTRPRDATADSSVFNANASGTYVCQPWSRALVGEFRDAMALCFSEALRQGLTLYIRPHLDDGLAKGAWRNGLLLQPTTMHGGFSYWDIMLAPLADALRKALATSTREGTIKPPPGRSRPAVYFALQGEMSAAIVRYASDWAAVIPALKQRALTGTGAAVAAASDATNTSAAATALPAAAVDLKIGIGLNFNRLDDTSSTDKRYGSSRLSWLLWRVGATEAVGVGVARQAPPIDIDGLRTLFNTALDFVGVSAYAPYNLDQDGHLRPEEFGNSADQFARELADTVGIDLKRLLQPYGRLELHYSEFGIGGGASYSGTEVARGPADVALRPFFGVYGPYNAARDPWVMPANAAFRRQFYSSAMAWLADPNNKQYRLAGVFVWSMASWDVLGIHPESYEAPGAAGGGYRDAAVVAAAARYNSAVRQAAIDTISAAATSVGVASAADEGGAPRAAAAGR